jgi:hypothetical protein
MSKILVLITLSDSGIETIKSTPDLPKKETEFVNLWREQQILESFFISVSKKSDSLEDDKKTCLANSLIENLSDL